MVAFDARKPMCYLENEGRESSVRLAFPIQTTNCRVTVNRRKFLFFERFWLINEEGIVESEISPSGIS